MTPITTFNKRDVAKYTLQHSSVVLFTAEFN
ncbi:hypothetical protein swp_0698 [Shewanella piezotolerans WP3]|uniref:Uncharacterized protein n=1 Tax=Shewanella piezotolerans (strain WP3 / JCM 13877) TaxID=225849 RepID=B8CIN9_SHEPW|nr:hypothetical protein swp_0698 [Shewanella piezotolerans WP3]